MALVIEKQGLFKNHSGCYQLCTPNRKHPRVENIDRLSLPIMVTMHAMYAKNRKNKRLFNYNPPF